MLEAHSERAGASAPPFVQEKTQRRLAMAQAGIFKRCELIAACEQENSGREPAVLIFHHRRVG